MTRRPSALSVTLYPPFKVKRLIVSDEAAPSVPREIFFFSRVTALGPGNLLFCPKTSLSPASTSSFNELRMIAKDRCFPCRACPIFPRNIIGSIPASSLRASTSTSYVIGRPSTSASVKDFIVLKD